MNLKIVIPVYEYGEHYELHLLCKLPADMNEL